MKSIIKMMYDSNLMFTLNQMNETYQHPGKWHDILLIPTLTRSTGNHYIMSHVIRGLEGNSVYEAIVQAKNRYGWNEVIVFYTFTGFSRKLKIDKISC